MLRQHVARVTVGLCLALAVAITVPGSDAAEEARHVLLATYGSGPAAELAMNYVRQKESVGKFQMYGFATFWRELTGEINVGERHARDPQAGAALNAIVSGQLTGLPPRTVEEIQRSIRPGTIAVVAVVPERGFAEARRTFEVTGPRHLMTVALAPR